MGTVKADAGANVCAAYYYYDYKEGREGDDSFTGEGKNLESALRRKLEGGRRVTRINGRKRKCVQKKFPATVK